MNPAQQEIRWWKIPIPALSCALILLASVLLQPGCGGGGDEGGRGNVGVLFTDSSRWSAYDAGNTGGLATVGYYGAALDGRYVYFVPEHDGTAAHSRVLRYDTQGSFTGNTAWTVYDASGTGTNSLSYIGAVFDGRYVYFAPWHNGTVYHGEVLRYDTQGAFAAAGSWAVFDAGNTGGLDSTGFIGAVFDGRHVYLVPHHNNAGESGIALRYDTQGGGFTNPASWEAYDASGTGGLTETVGYSGGVFDGRYVYYSPFRSATTVYHGKMLRYDTQGGFTIAASWTAYDAGGTDGLVTVGYVGGTFDGRYVFFAPRRDDTQAHGRVLRYDTQGGVFTDSANWSAYDAGNAGGLSGTMGYSGALFDGRFVYFMPDTFGTTSHGKAIRYDSQAPFIDAGSWQAYDAGNTGGLSDTTGYHFAVFDGRFIYFVPGRASGGVAHGRVLRYDTGGVN